MLTIPTGCAVCHTTFRYSRFVTGASISPDSRPMKCANREMRNSQFVLEEAPNLGVALLEQEIGSCPLRAHTRVSIPRSVELGDSSLSHRVALPGRRAFELRN